MDRRCIVYHTPGLNGGDYRLIENPTIGDVRRARSKGAIIIKRVVERIGDVICGAWVTDTGTKIVVWETPCL